MTHEPTQKDLDFLWEQTGMIQVFVAEHRPIEGSPLFGDDGIAIEEVWEVAFEITARDELQVFQQLCRVVDADPFPPNERRPMTLCEPMCSFVFLDTDREPVTTIEFVYPDELRWFGRWGGNAELADNHGLAEWLRQRGVVESDPPFISGR